MYANLSRVDSIYALCCSGQRDEGYNYRRGYCVWVWGLFSGMGGGYFKTSKVSKKCPLLGKSALLGLKTP